MLTLLHSNREHLLSYVCQQLENFFPDHDIDHSLVVSRHFDETLERLEICINAVKMWRVGEFDYLHSTQYAFFIYFYQTQYGRMKRINEFAQSYFT